MTDCYPNTRKVIDRYNQIASKVWAGREDTDNDEDEFVSNHCIYLAHALIKDVGESARAREELCKAADIINDVCR